MTSLVVLLYRIALFGLPAGFRSRYGEGMVEEARLGLDEAWGRGRLSYLVAIGRLGTDCLVTWVREWGSRFNARLRPSLQPVVALRLALKGLLRSPGTTIPAVTILAVGLAAPVTFFSLFVGATRPLPVPEGERVVSVVVEQPQRDDGRLAVQLSDLAVLARLSTLESLGAFRTFTGTILDPETTASRVAVAALTADVLPLLRVAPSVGRVPETNDVVDEALDRAAHEARNLAVSISRVGREGQHVGHHLE